MSRKPKKTLINDNGRCKISITYEYSNDYLHAPTKQDIKEEIDRLYQQLVNNF